MKLIITKYAKLTILWMTFLTIAFVERGGPSIFAVVMIFGGTSIMIFIEFLSVQQTSAAEFERPQAGRLMFGHEPQVSSGHDQIPTMMISRMNLSHSRLRLLDKALETYLSAEVQSRENWLYIPGQSLYSDKGVEWSPSHDPVFMMPALLEPSEIAPKKGNPKSAWEDWVLDNTLTGRGSPPKSFAIN